MEMNAELKALRDAALASIEAEDAMLAKRDAQMKRKGMKFRITAWIHPSNGGDDRCIDWYEALRPTAQLIQTFLKKRGSEVLNDYVVVKL